MCDTKYLNDDVMVFIFGIFQFGICYIVGQVSTKNSFIVKYFSGLAIQLQWASLDAGSMC